MEGLREASGEAGRLVGEMEDESAVLLSLCAMVVEKADDVLGDKVLPADAGGSVPDD